MDSSPTTDQATASPSSPSIPPPPPAGLRDRMPGRPLIRLGRPVPTFQPPTPSATNPDATGSGIGSVPDPIDSGPTPSSADPSKRAGVVKIDKRALSEIIQSLILSASLFLHNALATTEEEQAANVWVATGQDQQQIGDPLGSIAVRHGAPAGAGADAADLIAAGIGAAAYLARNVSDAWQIRRARKKLARTAPQADNHETGEPA